MESHPPSLTLFCPVPKMSQGLEEASKAVPNDFMCCGQVPCPNTLPEHNNSVLWVVHKLSPSPLVTYQPLGVLPRVPDVISLQLPLCPLKGWLHPSDFQEGAGFVE